MASRTQTVRLASRVLRHHHIRQRRLNSSASANPDEISHFDNLAKEWWAPHGSSRLLHQMNPLRHDFINSCLASDPQPVIPKQRRYLDVGCGGGIFAESAARLKDTASVLAIDPSNEVIKVARTHALQDPLLQQPERLVYENKSLEDLSIPTSPSQQFDVLTLFEVIEHISRPAPFLQMCLPFVKPGGWIILSTIARTWASWMTTKVVAENVVGLVPRGTHDWEKYVNEDELRNWFAKQECWGTMGLRSQGAIYVPGFGWKMVEGGEQWGNYFFGVRRNPHG